MRRVPTIALLMVGALGAEQTLAIHPQSDDGYTLIAEILSDHSWQRETAADALVKRADPSLVPGLVDAFFFTPKQSRAEITAVLEALTGQRYRDYYDWVEYVGSHEEIEPAPGYLAWKRSVLARIDSDYETVLYDGAPARIRLEEIVWGGIPLAGIPALDDPPTVPGSTARYLRRQEKVFGIEVGGETRAYPLRILSWHELVNDEVGGEPIALSYCTLCGSGVFFRTATPNGGRYRFDTSGLLYRSNKLMVDRGSRTLWSNLSGEPVVGRLAATSAKIEMLPGVVTTWEAWIRRHPATTVLDLEGIEDLMHPRYSFDYRPGAAEQRRRGVSFPVWKSSAALERDREIFALRLAGAAKAYPVSRVLELQAINDDIDGEPVVILGDPSSGAVRAYRRGNWRFEWTKRGDLLDSESREWKVAEDGLTLVGSSDSPVFLERLPGHLAFWFGWYGSYPQTEVWRQ